MHKILLIIIICSVTIVAFSQKIDSVKYENGFLFYRTYGHGEPVIILSGGPGNSCLQEQEVAIKLSTKYQSILLEQRGTGLSVPIPFDSTTINLKSALSDLNLLLDHLKLKKAILIGHSWGGTLAMSYAAEFPKRVKKMILVAPGSFNLNQDFRLGARDSRIQKFSKDELMRFNYLVEKEKTYPLTKNETDEILKITYTGYIYDKLGYDEIYTKIAVEKSPKMNGLMRTDLDRIKFDLTKTLGNYKKPMYIICGRQDALAFIAYELKLLYPKTEIDWIQKCDHFPAFERPDDFYKLLFKRLE